MNRHSQDFVNAAKITAGTVIVGSALMANAGTRVVLYGTQQGLTKIGKTAKHIEAACRAKEKELANPQLYASAQVILNNVKNRVTFHKPAAVAA